MKYTQKLIILILAILTGIPCLECRAAEPEKKLGLTTICIDPGHGGHDAGCISRDGKKTMEKNIVLGIGLKLRKMLRESYPDMKVVMTREDDRFIELSERAAIANRNNAGLFISIHVNSLDPKNNKNWKNVTGYSVHCLGQSRTGRDLYSSNMDLCKRENSVILLENDYSTKYEGFDPNDPESYIIFNLMQNANLTQSLDFAGRVADRLSEEGPIKHNRGISQDPFLVLWKTTMPAVLIECGFITNANDLASMRSEAGQTKIAKGIFNAIASFKKSYDNSLSVGGGSRNQKETPSAVADEGVLYGTQILATGKKMKADDPFFKGYTPTQVPAGRLYKYLIGVSADKEEALEKYKEIKKAFPDSFRVKYEDGVVSRL